MINIYIINVSLTILKCKILYRESSLFVVKNNYECCIKNVDTYHYLGPGSARFGRRLLSEREK